MTIRRQYILPNCTLTIEGWSSDPEGETASQGRPTLSLPVGVECRFTGENLAFTGDKDLLDALVSAVNRYAQEFLSGVPRIAKHKLQTPVRLDPVAESHLHRLSWEKSADNGATSQTQHLDLSTVQLFDLVEAVDQFLDDRTTLPEWTLQLQPLPRSARRREQPLTQRAKAPALGLVGLAAAAIASFLVPVPEVVRDPEPRAATEEELTENADSFPVDVEETVALLPPIDDPELLERLATRLERTIDGLWQNRGSVEQPLEYRVWVTRIGEVVGYRELEESDRLITEAPVLPDLLDLPSQDSLNAGVGSLRVVYFPNGTVEVTPWQSES